MARLPNPGSDEGRWGQILNDYLSQAHKADGTLKDGSVAETKLSSAVVAKLNTVAGQQGSTGATGPSGSAGAPGASGARGATGVQGPAGATGSVGAAGTHGATGPIGPSGSNGSVGATGVPGLQGATGPAGPTGAQGASGAAGATTIGGISGLQSALDDKADFASLAEVATTGDYNDLTNKPTVSAAGVVSVYVTTGSEARPAGDTVLWIGGATQPTNMGNGDIWFSQDPPVDSVPPSGPSNLASSNITSNSFTLTWSASMDNVGTTAYEIFINNISYSIVTSTSVTVNSRAANTTYICKIRARDGAGNWSSYSDELEVTTITSIATEHTVFASATYPGLLKYTEAGNITVATAFYTGNSGTNGWNVKGARVYVPVGVSITGACEMYLYLPSSGSAPNLASPTQSITMPSVTSGQWNDINFSAPVTVDPGQAFWVGYRFNDTSYMSTTSVGGGAIKASDDAELYMSPNATPVGALYRNYYRIGAGGTNNSSVGGQGYGIDVIVSEV